MSDHPPLEVSWYTLQEAATQSGIAHSALAAAVRRGRFRTARLERDPTRPDQKKVWYVNSVELASYRDYRRGGRCARFGPLSERMFDTIDLLDRSGPMTSDQIEARVMGKASGRDKNLDSYFNRRLRDWKQKGLIYIRYYTDDFTRHPSRNSRDGSGIRQRGEHRGIGSRAVYDITEHGRELFSQALDHLDQAPVALSLVEDVG